MADSGAIVNPVNGIETLAPLSILVSNQNDFHHLCNRMRIPASAVSGMFMSRLASTGRYSLVGPMIGAPYAVMLLENVIARGAETILFFGWGGAISPDVKIGDVIIPTGAIIDEGTSSHYQETIVQATHPSKEWTDQIKELLGARRVACTEGLIWSTDAPYRETKEKVIAHQQRGVKAVEMEISALFSVGRFRQVQVAAIVVVSDELSSLKWQPGFQTERFRRSRAAVCDVIQHLCEPK